MINPIDEVNGNIEYFLKQEDSILTKRKLKKINKHLGNVTTEMNLLNTERKDTYFKHTYSVSKQKNVYVKVEVIFNRNDLSFISKWDLVSSKDTTYVQNGTRHAYKTSEKEHDFVNNKSNVRYIGEKSN